MVLSNLTGLLSSQIGKIIVTVLIMVVGMAVFVAMLPNVVKQDVTVAAGDTAYINAGHSAADKISNIQATQALSTEFVDQAVGSKSTFGLFNRDVSEYLVLGSFLAFVGVTATLIYGFIRGNRSG